jgi:hypothetical protein
MKTTAKTATPCTITLVVQDVRPVEYAGQVMDHPQFFLRLQLADGSSIDARISRTDYEKVRLNIVPQ